MGVAFSRSKDHRPIYKTKSEYFTPGPGKYEVPEDNKAFPTQDFGHPRTQNRAASMFSSTTTRLGIANRRAGKGPALPGPGSYNPKKDQEMGRRKPKIQAKYQFFASSTRKDYDAAISTSFLQKARTAPGPTDYSNAYESSFKSLDEVFGADPYKVHAGLPFSTTVPRFSSKESVADLPGPGAYVEQADPTYELSKNSFGRNNSFGSTVSRFPHKRIPNVPGPGNYTGVKIKKAPSKNSVFASANPRFRGAQPDPDAPGPVSYSPSNDFKASRNITKRVGGNSVFVSHHKRTSVPKVSIHTPSAVGPATYNGHAVPGPAQSSLGSPVHGPGVSRFRDTTARFQDAAKLSSAFPTSPGPGSHSGSNSADFSLHKRSYNISVGSL